MYAVSSEGSVLWTYPTQALIWSSASIGPDGTVYVGSADYSFYCLNGTTGSLKWRRTSTGGVHSSPALDPVSGTLFYGCNDGSVYAVDASDGAVRSVYTAASYFTTSPVVGPNGLLYIGGYDGAVLALRMSGPVGAVVWRFPTGHTLTLSSFALGPDGTLYVGAGDARLYALTGMSIAARDGRLCIVTLLCDVLADTGSTGCVCSRAASQMHPPVHLLVAATRWPLVWGWGLVSALLSSSPPQ